MARNHVRWQFGVWRKPEHRETGKDARLLYMTICGDEALNQAGVVVLRPSAWAEDAGMTEDEADAALHELVERRFVVVDWHTRDLLVRTFIRNDGVAEQPNVLRSALKIAANVRSDLVKKVLAEELRKLPAKPDDKTLPSGKTFSYPDPHAVADEIDPGDVEPPNPPRKPSPNPSKEPFGEPHGVGGGVGERSNGSSRSFTHSRSNRESQSQQATLDGSETSAAADAAVSKRSSSSREVEHPRFAEFWDGWPRKTSKSNARKAFTAAVRRGADPGQITEAAATQAEQWRRENLEVRYVPHAATWLNQARYDDPVQRTDLRLVSSSESPWGGTYAGPESPWASGWS